MPKILIGNKSDIKKRECSYKEGKMLADRNKMKFLETSVKENKNLNETIFLLAMEYYEKKHLIEKK